MMCSCVKTVYFTLINGQCPPMSCAFDKAEYDNSILAQWVLDREGELVDMERLWKI